MLARQVMLGALHIRRRAWGRPGGSFRPPPGGILHALALWFALAIAGCDKPCGPPPGVDLPCSDVAECADGQICLLDTASVSHETCQVPCDTDAPNSCAAFEDFSIGHVCTGGRVTYCNDICGRK